MTDPAATKGQDAHDYYDTMVRQRGIDEAFEIAVDDVRKSRAEVAALKAKLAEAEGKVGQVEPDHSFAEYVLDFASPDGPEGPEFFPPSLLEWKNLRERAHGALATAKPVEAGVRPRIVCLCGSTRFMEAFQQANLDETIAGRIVLSVGCNTKADGDLFKGPDAKEIKTRLDTLHKQKIELSDEILVLNVGGYIGESTRSEIEHAVKTGKPVRYLEPIVRADKGGEHQ